MYKVPREIVQAQIKKLESQGYDEKSYIPELKKYVLSRKEGHKIKYQTVDAFTFGVKSNL